jgi:GNAT superfamily N-acetyltransferase
VKSLAQESKQRVVGWREGWRRLFGRLRHGLLIQEILDRLARAGCIVYPYFIVLERAPDQSEFAPDPRCTFRMLSAEDTADIIRASEGRATAQRILGQLARGMCVAIFYDGQLAGWTWVELDAVRIPISLEPVFPLQSSEAYLFDMYVAPPYRGLRLAGVLRQAVQRELIRRGRTRFYSITLAFNRSSHRFKSRLGARELELRIYLHGRLGRLPGCDLRLWRWKPHLPSACVRRVPAIVTMKPRA